MTHEVFYLLPYLVSFLLSLVLGGLGWSRRRTPGASGFMIVCWSQAFWTFGFILETTSLGLTSKIFWDNLEFAAMFGVAVATLVMADEYTRHEIVERNRLWLYLWAFPALCLVLIFLDPGGILRPNLVLLPAGPFTSLYYPYTAFMWLMMLYFYALMGASAVVLIRSLRMATVYYRRQTLWLVAGLCVPLLAALPSVFDVLPPAHRDIAPLVFVLGNLLVSVGLFRYGLFDVLPIARETVIEQIATSVIVLDSGARVVDFNGAAQAAFGLQQNDLGKGVGQLDARWADIVAQADPGVRINETFESLVEGMSTYFDLTVAPFYDEHGRFLGRIVMIHNITEQMETERVLRERTRETEDANRELETFAYAVSHDLRAPLRAIRGFTQILLRDHADNFNGDAGTLLQHVINAATEMSERIESLLALSRQTRGEVSRAQVNLSDIANEVVRKLQEEEPGRQVTWRIDDQLMANADPSLMRTALENLLGNAWKYTGPTEHPCIEFGARENGGEPIYFVRDNGVGFDMQSADGLFTPFRRLHGPGEFVGEGIGLATVQRIIHRHNGRIWAEAQPNEGAVFYFTLS